MMTQEEVEQLVNEKVTIAISVYETIRSIKAGSKAVEGQETIIKDVSEGNANTKKEQDGNQEKNAAQHQNKKQKVIETCDAEQNIKRGYLGNHPYCGSCDRHHTGPCTIVCNVCRKIGHKARNCRSPAPVAKAVTPGVCYKCGGVDHFRNNCPKFERPMLKKIQGEAYMTIPKGAVEIKDTGKGYKGNYPYCTKCGRHHTGRCTITCNICKKVGHMAKNCKIAAPIPITAVPMTCYECGAAGHFKKNCPTLKKQMLKQPKEEPI